jgi:hypothetical protein
MGDGPDVDAEWARIVAAFHTEVDPAARTWPAAENLDQERRPGDRSDDPPGDPSTAPDAGGGASHRDPHDSGGPHASGAAPNTAPGTGTPTGDPTSGTLGPPAGPYADRRNDRSAWTDPTAGADRPAWTDPYAGPARAGPADRPRTQRGNPDGWPVERRSRPRPGTPEEPSLLDALDTFGTGLPDDPTDDEGYTPPPPPPLPRISKYAVAAVLAIVAGFVLFLFPTLVPVDPDMVMLTGFTAILVGFVTLVWRLRPGDDEEEDDPEDGAVV